MSLAKTYSPEGIEQKWYDRWLAAKLAPGGYLLVVDDMPEPGLPAEPAARLAEFKRCWRCPVAPDRAGWIAALQAAGLNCLGERDLNALLQVRAMPAMAPRLVTLRRRSWPEPAPKAKSHSND
jgi:hypothetical protein